MTIRPGSTSSSAEPVIARTTGCRVNGLTAPSARRNGESLVLRECRCHGRPERDRVALEIRVVDPDRVEAAVAGLAGPPRSHRRCRRGRRVRARSAGRGVAMSLRSARCCRGRPCYVRRYPRPYAGMSADGELARAAAARRSSARRDRAGGRRRPNRWTEGRVRDRDRALHGRVDLAVVGERPALRTFRTWPLLRLPLPSAASSNVTVCAVSSPLVQVTLSPTFAFTDAGLNAKFLIVTAVTAPPPPPVEGAADAAAAGAAAGGAAVGARRSERRLVLLSRWCRSRRRRQGARRRQGR